MHYGIRWPTIIWSVNINAHIHTHTNILHTYVYGLAVVYRGVEVYHAGLLYHTVVLIWCTT
jgi:hypothetical protein